MVGKIITGFYIFYRYFLRIKAKFFFNKFYKEVIFSFEKFSEYGQISSSSKNSRQPIKGYDLIRILDKYNPNYICELGSGTTSAVFLAWSKKNNAVYKAYESFEKWTTVTKSSINHIEKELDETILHIPSLVSPQKNSTRFSNLIPESSDFVYIDGPPCVLENGIKVPNDDIILFFDSGYKPQIIVIDGRLETVDLINNHENSSNYNFYPSYQYSRKNRLFISSLNFREHSIFVLK